MEQIWRQPLFKNPAIHTTQDPHIGEVDTQGMLHFINIGCHIVTDLWDEFIQDWKQLRDIDMKCQQKEAIDMQNVFTWAIMWNLNSWLTSPTTGKWVSFTQQKENPHGYTNLLRSHITP
jgi:hypothetical protein